MIDKTCLDIIRTFQWPRGNSYSINKRPSIYKISKELGIHPLIVKKKINEMFSIGLIRDIKYYIDERFNEWNRYFILINNSTNIIQNLSSMFPSLPYVERLIYGHLNDKNLNNVGFFIGISLICKDDSELDERIQILSNLCPEVKKYITIMREHDEKIFTLNNTDIRIANSMIKQSPLNFSINKIALETNIPLRTVRRRIEKMLENRVIYEEISFDTSTLEFGLMPSIILKSTPEFNIETIEKLQLPGRKWLIMKEFGEYIFMVYHVKNFKELELLSSDFSLVTDNFMISFRNGSINNPYIVYP